MKVEASHPIHVTKRTDRTLITHIAHSTLRIISPVLTKPPKPFPPGSPQLIVPRGVNKSCHVHERQVEFIWIYDLISKRQSSKTISDGHARRIYCIVGGSFRTPPRSDHWHMYAHLATEIPNATISIISPQLAPVSSAPTAFPHLVRLCKKASSSCRPSR